jgi:hypothetical protein
MRMAAVGWGVSSMISGSSIRDWPPCVRGRQAGSMPRHRWSPDFSIIRYDLVNALTRRVRATRVEPTD